MIRLFALLAAVATLGACARTEPNTGFPIVDKSGAVIGMTDADGMMTDHDG